MKNKLSEKVLCLITILLILATVLLSLIFSPKKGVLVFFLVFSLIYWQKKRLQGFFQKIKHPKTGWVVYLLTGWLGAIFLEFSLGISPFHPRPITNYLNQNPPAVPHEVKEFSPEAQEYYYRKYILKDPAFQY